jgi:hypothetical protein
MEREITGDFDKAISFKSHDLSALMMKMQVQ